MDHLKNLAKKIVTTLLRWEAKMIIRRYQPKIIAVTGSVGKTGTKDAIHFVLAQKFSTGKSKKSYNSDFGVPLAIIGGDSAWNNPWGWLKVLARGLWLFIKKTDYPKIMVLEVGADRPGDIAAITAWLPVDVALITKVPDIPGHIEFFADKHAVLDEKFNLLKAVSDDGYVLANGDDDNIAPRLFVLNKPLVRCGFNSNNDYRGDNWQITYQSTDWGQQPTGSSLEIIQGEQRHHLDIPGRLGQHQLYANLFAYAVATREGMSPEEIIKAMAEMPISPGRFNLLAGVKKSTIIDDTYNASPAAVSEALNTLGLIHSPGKKIAVLGDMLELGSLTAEAHRQIGRLASQQCDLIITVGMRMKFAQESALEAGFEPDKLIHFDESSQAGKPLENMIGTGDIVLVKGSQGMRLERVVEEIMAEPERRQELLVRQEEVWKNR